MASILAALSRNPHDVSPYRIAAAKYAMIRGIKKIAMEYKARQRGQLTRNAYVSSLLAKFQDDDFTSKPVRRKNKLLCSSLFPCYPHADFLRGCSIPAPVLCLLVSLDLLTICSYFHIFLFYSLCGRNSPFFLFPRHQIRTPTTPQATTRLWTRRCEALSREWAARVARAWACG